MKEPKILRSWWWCLRRLRVVAVAVGDDGDHGAGVGGNWAGRPMIVTPDSGWGCQLSLGDERAVPGGADHEAFTLQDPDGFDDGGRRYLVLGR